MKAKKTVNQMIKEMNKKGFITPGQAEKLDTHARDQAAAQLRSITEMVAALDLGAKKQGPEGDDAHEEALERIREDALSVEVRSAWHEPGKDAESVEYCILLCTGGPAVRIIGALSVNDEPDSAQIQYQDWGTPWTEYRLTSEEEQTVLSYARCFYYGE